MPDMTPLCKECEVTHTKQLMWVFKLARNVQKRVYIVEKSVFESDYNLKPPVDYEPFTINAQDGSEFTVDPTVSLKIVDGKSPVVFKKYRKELSDVINSTLYNYVKDAFRIQLNQFSTDYIVSHRDSIEKAIESYLSKSLIKENFQLEQLTSGLKYPKTIVDAVDAKNKAVQEAMRVQNEVEVTKAEAEKLLVKARAEKEANELRTQALTPAVLEKMWIEKWDGKLPVYGQVPTIFKDISK